MSEVETDLKKLREQVLSDLVQGCLPSFVAVHEAGHAVAAFAASWPIGDVLLHDDGHAAGSVLPLAFPNPKIPAELRRFVFATYGGMAATFTISGEPSVWGPLLKNEDCVLALQVAAERYTQTKSALHFLNHRWRRAVSYMGQSHIKNHVVRLARLLDEKRKLSRDDVSKLLSTLPEGQLEMK